MNTPPTAARTLAPYTVHRDQTCAKLQSGTLTMLVLSHEEAGQVQAGLNEAYPVTPPESEAALSECRRLLDEELPEQARDMLDAAQADVELAYQHLLAYDLDVDDTYHIGQARAALARCLGGRASELRPAPMPGGE